MGSLVGNIKSSHTSRTRFVNGVKKDAEAIQADHQKFLKDMANDLSGFLSKTESSRKSDFKATMESIRDRITSIQKRSKEVRGDAQDFLGQLDKEMKELAADLKNFLSSSESTRMSGFNAMMKDITDTVDGLRSTTKGLLGDYASERKTAAAAWSSLPERHTASEEAVSKEATPAPRKRGRRKKK